MRRFLIAAVLTACATSAVAQDRAPCGKGLLARVEPDGTVSAGGKDRLLAAARNGERLRVGWDVGRPGEPPIVTHWQDALFVTVFEGEVFAQVGGLHRQQPLIGKAHIDLSAQDQRWNSSIGTNGRLQTKMSGDEKLWDQKVRSYWCRAAS